MPSDHQGAARTHPIRQQIPDGLVMEKRQVATVVLSLLDSCVDVSAREGLRFRFGGGISDSSRRLKVQHNKLIMSIVCIMEAFILTTPNI